MVEEIKVEKQSISVRILELIAASDGMRFTDIQAACYAMSRPTGKPFGTLERDYTGRMVNPNRGWWCTNLLGTHMHHAGLLRTYCTKGADGLWRRNSTPIPANGKPWSGVSRDVPFRGAW